MKCVCKKLSVCLKCVFASRIDFSWNLVPLYTTVSKNAVSVSNVSVVNSIVRWCKLACSMKASISGLLMSNRERISCMWHFQTVVLKTVLLRVVVSIYVMKILAKESKLLSLCPLQFHGFVGIAFH